MQRGAIFQLLIFILFFHVRLGAVWSMEVLGWELVIRRVVFFFWGSLARL